MALNGLNCAYVPLRNYSLTHPDADIVAANVLMLRVILYCCVLWSTSELKRNSYLLTAFKHDCFEKLQWSTAAAGMRPIGSRDWDDSAWWLSGITVLCFCRAFGLIFASGKNFFWPETKVNDWRMLTVFSWKEHEYYVFNTRCKERISFTPFKH